MRKCWLKNVLQCNKMAYFVRYFVRSRLPLWKAWLGISFIEMLFSLKRLNLAVSGFPSTVKPYAELHKGNLVLCQPASIYLRLRVKLCKWNVKVYKNNESEMPGIYPYLISEFPLWTLDIFFFLQFSFFFFFYGPSTFYPGPSTLDPQVIHICWFVIFPFRCLNNYY